MNNATAKSVKGVVAFVIMAGLTGMAMHGLGLNSHSLAFIPILTGAGAGLFVFRASNNA